MAYTAAVITVSDKGYQGLREDTSGPNLVRILREKGFEVTYTAIVPDDSEMIRRELCTCADTLGIALILTTGGTGCSPRDINLPGSKKASAENILAVIDPVAHGLDMLYSEGSADCAK